MNLHNQNILNVQMEKDIENGKAVKIKASNISEYEVKHCRRCELICPVGNRKEYSLSL